MSNLSVVIRMADTEGVDEDALRQYFDDAVAELPKSIVETIGDGWEVTVREQP